MGRRPGRRAVARSPVLLGTIHSGREQKLNCSSTRDDRQGPAMEASVANALLSLADLVRVLEESEVAQRSRLDARSPLLTTGTGVSREHEGPNLFSV